MTTPPLDPWNYDLPEERIAQRPVHPYDTAKLLVISRSNSKLTEATFRELPEFLSPNDTLFINDTKVIPARFLGTLPGGGGAEVLILDETKKDEWLSIGRPLKRFKEGTVISFGANLHAKIIARPSSERVLLSFYSDTTESVKDLMMRVGIMPIPPYIRGGKGDAEDRADYQTIFAQHEGSVAAPTASLHFTPELLQSIIVKGIGISYVTLHVGAASFLPLWHDHEPELRKPGFEKFVYSSSVMRAVEATKKRGGRVIAIGTTVVRALESMAKVGAAGKDGEILSTDLFITPGYKFQAVDSIVTNFHQPRTTHLLLVQAAMGKPLLEQAYQHALGHKFRFLSYGDGMLIS